VPIPGTTVREFTHVSHRYILERVDGVQMVFTDEIEDVAELGKVLFQATSERMSADPASRADWRRD
jgi:hypothetical protein